MVFQLFAEGVYLCHRQQVPVQQALEGRREGLAGHRRHARLDLRYRQDSINPDQQFKLRRRQRGRAAAQLILTSAGKRINVVVLHLRWLSWMSALFPEDYPSFKANTNFAPVPRQALMLSP